MAEGSGLDIATLGIRVDATQVDRGRSALDNLTAAGDRAERRFITLEEFDRRRARSSQVLNRALQERAQTEREVAAMMGGTAAATEEVATKSRLAGAPIARLNNSMVVLARQAAGAHPVVGQLTDAIGTFAIGTAKMVPVLAGLAAVSLAIRRLTQDSREAKERLAEAREELERIAQLQGLPVGGEAVAQVGVVRQRLFAREAERGRLARQLATEQNLGLRRGLEEQIAAIDAELPDLRRLISAGEAQIAEREFESRMDALRERLRDATYVITQDLANFDRAFNEAQLAGARAEQLAYSRGLAGATPPLGAPPSGIGVLINSPAFRKLAEEQQLLIEEQRQAEEDLNEARIRANDALIRSLENIGRAYGGVTDQIIALSAATFRIWEGGPLPGFGPGQTATRGDMVRGYGTAALTGIGFGVSTGNPILGGIGGGLAGGFAAGPAGAIVGAVGGVVSGLIESGRRAEEAARIWRNSLREFELMFDDLSPLEQDMVALDRAFEQLSGGRSRAEVEQAIENLRRLQQQYHDPTGAIEEQIARYEELLRIYGDNAEQAEALAEAERDLYDARFRALNAPSGFNLAYHGFLAGSSFVGGSSEGGDMSVGDVTVNVYGSDDPEDTARRVVDEIRRQAKRGGGDPLNYAFR